MRPKSWGLLGLRILFLILAHDRPDRAVELATRLVSAASDAHALIHYDANSPKAQRQALETLLSEQERVASVARPTRCFWGDFSLVRACLRALEQARDEAAAQGRGFDHVILLSGACLPSRPVRQLERFLQARPDSDFIEAYGPEWPIAGYREDRFDLYHPFRPLTRQQLERPLIALQRKLKVKRRPPLDMAPRMGSQWWCLRWSLCLEILDLIDREPSVVRYFRRVWIPDESFFQSLAHHLSPSTIAGHGLTFYQFSKAGRPIKFYDDHGDRPFGLEFFFFRKAAARATELRRRALEIAAAPDDDADLSRIGAPDTEYANRVDAQIAGPKPAQLYMMSQYRHRTDRILAADKTPYLVILGPEEPARRLTESFDPAATHDFGALFDPTRAAARDFAGSPAWAAEMAREAPAIFLSMARRRAIGVPLLRWRPGDAPEALIEAILDDRAATVIPVDQAAAARAEGRAATVIDPGGAAAAKTLAGPVGPIAARALDAFAADAPAAN
ncbi:MAG: beta-1,6-N-acetylglucosaminyltransferase [Pseudomonadota bacterium]